MGESGKVYALNIHPLAHRRVQNIASRRRLVNIKTIHSDCATELTSSSIDIILLYDTLHHLARPDEVLEELHRVLKPDGVLSVIDHHLQENEIMSGITGNGLFGLSKRGKKVYEFFKKG